MGSESELVFVFLGKHLPKYAKASLKIASVSSGLRVILLGNESMRQEVSGLGVEFTPVEDFYDPEQFNRASSHVWSDHKFRGGLWLKSLERLFVLKQYMEFSGTPTLLHAELDQLAFNLCFFKRKLDALQYKGLFVPMHSPSSAVASILYINDIDALNSLIDFANADNYFPNEMYLIADWARLNPDKFFELPTTASVVKGRHFSLIPGARLVGTDEVGGLVDAAQLGQWVAGIDPKNISLGYRPTNKFVDDEKSYLLNLEELNSITFRLISNQLQIVVGESKERVNLFNLHIHSKIHDEILKGKLSLDDLIITANSTDKISLPGTRRQQLLGWFQYMVARTTKNPGKAIKALRVKVNKVFRVRLSSKPFISGDSFRAYSDLIWERNRTFSHHDVSIGDVVFCETDLLDQFSLGVLSQISVPIVLILGNSDKDLYREDFRKINLPAGSTVFAQNLREKIPNVQPLPIGLENRWRANNGTILSFRYLPLIRRARESKVLWGFSIATNPAVRAKAAFSLSRLASTVHTGSISARKHRHLLSKFMFVASPPGNGLDTHRTWEAMYLGCVPILLSSYLSKYYEDLGLPIWIVDSYDELNSLSDKDLRLKYRDVINRSSSEHLKFDVWKVKIKDASDKAKKLN